MPKRVLISGAGIAGLTAGLWLKRQGYHPVIVERSDSPRGGGFLVSLSHHAYRYANELGVLDAMRERDMRIACSSYHSRAVTPLLTLDYQKLFKDVEVLQIMRDDVIDVLHQKARNDMEIRFGDVIQHIDSQPDQVHVRFQSGALESFDLAIIAEGQNSITRGLLFPNEVEIDFLDLCCAAFRLPNIFNLESKFETHMRQGRYMALFTTPSGDLGSVFVWSSRARDVPEGADRKAFLTEAFQDAGRTISATLAHCPQESFYMDTLKQIRLNRWSKGRTVLLGDAAHCLTLFSGRGAAAAITGATRLAKQLELSGELDALERFEQESRNIIEPIQRETRRAVRWYVPLNSRDVWIRNAGMKYLPNWLFQQYFKMKYSNV